MGRIKWCWGKFHLHILYIGNDIQDMPLPNNFVSIMEYIFLPISYSVFKDSLHEICPKCYRFIRFFRNYSVTIARLLWETIILTSL